MKYFLSLFLIIHSAYSFTLNESKGRGFPKNNINIYIASNDCSGAGFSTNKLRSMVSDSVAKFWNKVSTADLYLDNHGIKDDLDIDGLTHEQAINTVVPLNSIVAGCNDDASGFNDPTILGSASIICESSSRCRSILILNSNNSALNSFSTSEIEAVIAHELGHAIGLGHSETQHSLMYYSTGNKYQKWLGQDDIDGVTYLYPHEQEGCGFLGNMGATIKLDDKNDHNFPFSGLMILSFGATLLLFRLLIHYREIFPIKLN